MHPVQQIVFYADSDDEPHEVPPEVEQPQAEDFEGLLPRLRRAGQERECFGQTQLQCCGTNKLSNYIQTFWRWNQKLRSKRT